MNWFTKCFLITVALLKNPTNFNFSFFFFRKGGIVTLAAISTLELGSTNIWLDTFQPIVCIPFGFNPSLGTTIPSLESNEPRFIVPITCPFKKKKNFIENLKEFP